MRHLGKSALLSAFIAASPLLARAQGNYRSTPIGGRSALMGGTGLAYGRDGAAPFNNPATIVNADDQQVAFSVNFYTFTVFRARNWYDPGPIDPRFGALQDANPVLTDLEFNALPSSLCLFLASTPKSRVAFCLASTQATSFSFSAEHFDAPMTDGRTTRQAQTMLESYSRFLFGPSYAVQVSNKLTFGVSLHGSLVAHRSAHNAVANTYAANTAPISSAFYSGTRGDSAQLSAVGGFTYRLQNQTLALALESPTVHVYGVGSANRFTHFEGVGTSSTRTTAIDGSFVSSTPLRVSLGVGFIGTRGIAEFNAHFYAPQAAAYRAELTGRAVTVEGGVARDEAVDVRLAQRSNAVFDVGIGGQYFLSKSLSALAGISTDLSAVPAGGLRGDIFNYYPTRSHRIAVSFGAGSHGDGEELLVGTELSYAFGERLAINSYQLPPVFGQSPHRTFVALFVVAGSTSLKAIARAVRDAADVIKKP